MDHRRIMRHLRAVREQRDRTTRHARLARRPWVRPYFREVVLEAETTAYVNVREVPAFEEAEEQARSAA